MPIQTIDPTTGEVVKTFEAMGASEIEERLARAASRASSYRRTTFQERRAWMLAAADVLDADTPEIARTMTLEMGKTRAAAEAEATKCAKGMRFYAEHAEAFLADVPLDDPSSV